MFKVPKIVSAQQIVLCCHKHKINDIVISPGSRNAPLIIGFSGHPEMNNYSVVDERSAGFFALGIAQQKRKPVVLVCTSGSAILNYYPAIAEAYYSRIPLIVISADRPSNLIDIADGQTIRQENVLDKHLILSIALKKEDTQDSSKVKINKALEASYKHQGPVHINVPFDEPLYDVIEDWSVDFKNSFLEPIEKSTFIDSSMFNKLVEQWNKYEKKIVLVGVCYPNESLQACIDSFLKNPSVLVFTEKTSNLHHPKIISCIDQLIYSLDELEFKDLCPDILISLGGSLISKRVKKFLRIYPPKEHWHIDLHDAPDTFFSLTQHIKEDVISFFKKFIPKINLSEKSTYQSHWISQRDKRYIKHLNYLEKQSYTDLKVFQKILKSIPDNSNLQVSNSSSIRYIQLFNLDASIRVFCNRGTSGIDGSTSTAVGAATASKRQTLLITGDLSFFYDSNAFWNSYIPSNFRVIIVNNNGGSIFRFIPGPKQTDSLYYFETPHNLTAVHIAKMHNFKYFQASSLEGISAVLEDFYKVSIHAKILEIFTSSEESAIDLKNYFNYLKTNNM